MNQDEMLKCLNAVANYMEEKDDSPLCAQDLRSIRNELETCWVELANYKEVSPIYTVE